MTCTEKSWEAGAGWHSILQPARRSRALLNEKVPQLLKQGKRFVQKVPATINSVFASNSCIPLWYQLVVPCVTLMDSGRTAGCGEPQKVEKREFAIFKAVSNGGLINLIRNRL